MRKRIISVYLLVILLMLCINDFVYSDSETLKFGLDIAGSHDITIGSSSASDSVDTGVAVSLEVVDNNMGVGITYQIPREISEYSSAKFNFIPIYFLYKICSKDSNQNEINPFLVGHIGYNFFMGNSDYRGTASLSGGLYYGAGFGLIFSNGHQFEFLYSLNTGSLDLWGIDVSYSKITLSYGVNFY